MSHTPIDNRAAYQTAKYVQSLDIRGAPYTSPKSGEIVIRARALGIAPIDWLKQIIGDSAFNHLKYPFVPGSDVAGEVVEVGSGVTRLKVGDRVAGNALGMDPKVAENHNPYGAFQKYVVLKADLTSVIPDALEFEKAAVLPLAVSTAATAMFNKDHLGLDLPPPSLAPKSKGEILLVWGASTSVGMNAIQLAVNAGYEVFATASQKNWEAIKALGAFKVWDYRSTTVVKDISNALRAAKGDGKLSAGALAIGDHSTQKCMDILGSSGIKGKKYVAEVSASALPKERPSVVDIAGIVGGMVAAKVSVLIKSTMSGVRTQFIWGTDLYNTEVARAIYQDFLPVALEQGKYRAVPVAVVVGHGLEQLQAALDRNRLGVSAQKLVVTL